MNAFYFFGTLDLNDSLAVLLESLKRGEDTWVCFFDSNKGKRQLYYYEKAELENYIKKICKTNKLKTPIVDFFSQNDELNFKNKFKSIEPAFIFCQFIQHKYPKWIPFIGSSKIIHLGWGVEDAQENLALSPYKKNIILNVLTRQRFLSKNLHEFKNVSKNFKYFGDLPASQLFFTPFDFEEFKNKKICFLPESWLQNGSKKWSREQGQSIDEVFKFLKEKGFFTVLKKREKGYPEDLESGFSNYISEVPDLFIKKDLLFPSSMISLPTESNLCIVLGTSGASEISEINQNTFSCVFHQNMAQETKEYINKNLEAPKPLKETIYQNYIKSNKNAASELLDYIDNKFK